MTLTSTPRTVKRRQLTNTNTDTLCTADGLLSTWIYRFNLWTGLYMLNPYEQFIFHLLGWFALIVSSAYFLVFWSGFQEGLQQASGAVVE
jgi:hypothetical protein